MNDKVPYYSIIKHKINLQRELIYIDSIDTKKILMIRVPLSYFIDNKSILLEFFFLTCGVLGFMGIALSRIYVQHIDEVIRNIAERFSKMVHSGRFKGKIKPNSTEWPVINNSLNQVATTIKIMQSDNDFLQETYESMKEESEKLTVFFNNSSHELKTPIVLIESCVGYMMEYSCTENCISERFANIIKEECQNLMTSITQVLSYSELKSELFHLRLEQIELMSLVSSLTSKFENILKNEAISIAFDIENIVIEGDHVRLEQALINYIANAIDHVDENKKLKLTMKKQNNSVRVSVYNSGDRIPLDVIPDIWDTFYMEEKHAKKKFGGSGLGLSIVRTIIEHHNGEFGVKNEKDGVEFFFILPLLQ